MGIYLGIPNFLDWKFSNLGILKWFGIGIFNFLEFSLENWEFPIIFRNSQLLNGIPNLGIPKIGNWEFLKLGIPNFWKFPIPNISKIPNSQFWEFPNWEFCLGIGNFGIIGNWEFWKIGNSQFQEFPIPKQNSQFGNSQYWELGISGKLGIGNFRKLGIWENQNSQFLKIPYSQFSRNSQFPN